MKKCFYSVFFITLFIFPCLNTGTAQETIGPKMLIEEADYDAKEVMQGEIISHTFKILNRGDQTLEKGSSR